MTSPVKYQILFMRLLCQINFFDAKNFIWAFFTFPAGMECALLNLLERGEKLLVLQNGIWGHRAAELGRRLQLEVHREVVPEGQVIGLDAVEKV